MAEARDLQESISLTSDLPSHNESPNGSDGTETEDDVSYETISRVPYTLILTICYVTLALVTWVLTCVLMHRPISAKSYDIHILNDSLLNDGGLYHEVATGFSKTKAYLRAIKVLEAITSVVTIPMTSAVCSAVAVVLLQRPPARGRRGYTLRQMMTLSDKLWTDPLLISKLVTGGWKRYGSVFLLCVIHLNLLGASISPVQNLVQSYKSHKVLAKGDVANGQVQPERISAKDSQILILDDQRVKNYDYYDDGNFDSKLRDITPELQKRLSATSLDTPQFRLWSRNQTADYKSRIWYSNIEIEGLYETNNQSTFRNLQWLIDPFWAHPPSRLNTGVFQQFVSRVDFNVNFTMISQAEFPKTCNEPDNLAIHQNDQYESEDTAYELDLCMSIPDQSWKQQLAKQDIVEELFMRINITGKRQLGRFGEPGVYYTKTTVRTTTGYFELPNYTNKQFPGPLLSDGPNSHCSNYCMSQNWGKPVISGQNLSSNSLWLRQRAPLYATTMAVFGNGSVFDKGYTELWSQNSAIPMCALLLKDDAEPDKECQRHYFGREYIDDKVAADYAAMDRVDTARSFLSLFIAAQDSSATVTSIERAFTAAAMLFIDEWHEQDRIHGFFISRSLCIDLQIPHMAKSGIVLVSTLLGVFLSCLIGLAIYSAITPRWTAQLDSFAMRRIGASIAPQLPFRLCRDASDVKVLDTLPGWVGEAPTGSSPKSGEISLGGTTGLSSKRRYVYYRRKHAAKKKGARANQTGQGR